jgi:5'-3' exoribonuclease 1
MGIKHCFIWFKNQYPNHMNKMRKGQTVMDVGITIDNLMIDMNGIFHNSAQKIYKYGNFKPKRSFINKHHPPPADNETELLLYKDVCSTIEELIKVTSPSKRVILCVDGPAPISKQNQQRQRRFRSAKESSSSKDVFDSNCITPGTLFMDNLGKYIDWFIRLKISKDPIWQKLDIIFSNEKAPGEGEHKGLKYIRDNKIESESYCINGLDADLIMLALGTHLPKFYIIREDMYDPSVEYFCVDVGGIHNKLSESMRWKSTTHIFNPHTAIEDFIFLCFIVGNDFLPHIPSIEIIQGGLELIIQICKQIGPSYGHITYHTPEQNVKFISKSLSIFLGTIGHHEKENFEAKLREKFIPDPLLDVCSFRDVNGVWSVDIVRYNQLYWEDKFPSNRTEEEICHEYLDGMQWVLSYYTKDVPNWKWHYKYHYAPPASILCKHFDTFKFTKHPISTPSTPYQQLLCVLPPKSSTLIPKPLCNLLTDENSPLKKYCPDTFEIDLHGKKKEWEGIVLLPIVDFNVMKKCYFDLISNINDIDIKRNIIGRSFSYNFDPKNPYLFNSYYGNIENCLTKIFLIDI